MIFRYRSIPGCQTQAPEPIVADPRGFRECRVRQDLQARLPSRDLGAGQDQRLTERCQAVVVSFRISRTCRLLVVTECELVLSSPGATHAAQAVHTRFLVHACLASCEVKATWDIYAAVSRMPCLTREQQSKGYKQRGHSYGVDNLIRNRPAAISFPKEPNTSVIPSHQR